MVKNRVLRKFLAAAILLVLLAAPRAEAGARYVFLFIGDGMGPVQRESAQLYLRGRLEAEGNPDASQATLVMNTLPAQGLIHTNNIEGKLTDSAAAGTALATGHKTQNGAISKNTETGELFDSIAVKARRRGMKVGIVTSSYIVDATPAVFYGHASHRSEYYLLGKQLSDSDFEYFGGGSFRDLSGPDGDLRDIARSKGYALTGSATESGSGAGKIFFVHPNLSTFNPGCMPYVIDGAEGPSLADFVRYGIRLLDSPAGFFLMTEGGRIDHACHSNDGAAAILETLAFDEAIKAAVDFMNTRPAETLIVVTSDHETGGMTLDPAADARTLYRLAGRRASFEAGGGGNPPDAAAGITWTTNQHTARDIPVSAAGVHSDLFPGEYENTEICNKLLEAIEAAE
ncbi:MAG: alkaline phosphatase [Synergistaceae bacterium]|jgi:alkaline phosphatase|nr:alkaline phosphatase [Synergistaceae bacterium]